MPKISSFIIGLVLIGLVASAFGLFMGEMNTHYARTDYNSSEFTAFDKLSELTDIVNETQQETSMEVDPTLTDIIGGYFKSAYQAMRVSVSSVSTFTDLTGTAVNKTGIPHAGLIQGSLVTIVLIIIFIGILISAIVKKDV